jgi:hypothetical protein
MMQVDTEIMDNGEIRYRMKDVNGSGYIRTKYEGRQGAWQNSHYHQSTLETYIVQKGSILYVELIEGQVVDREVFAGEVVTTQIGISHNIYLRPSTDFHTVKHGDIIVDDWYPCLILDSKLTSINQLYDDNLSRRRIELLRYRSALLQNRIEKYVIGCRRYNFAKMRLVNTENNINTLQRARLSFEG